METKDYMQLKKKLCKELERIAEKGSWSMSDIDTIDKLSHSIKSVCCVMGEEMEQSEASYRRGSYASYDNSPYQGSYRRMSRSADGVYSVDGTYTSDGSYRRGSYRDDSYASEGMTERLSELIHDERIPSNDRNAIIRAMDILKREGV